MSNQNQSGLLKLVHTPLESGIVKTFLQDNVLLNALPVINTNGSKLYEYNVVDTATTTTCRELGETVDANFIEPVRKSVVLSIYSNDSIVDRAFNYQLGNINDVRAEQAQVCATALSTDLSRSILYGDKSTNPKEMNGFKKLVQDGNGFKLSGITLDNLSEAADTVRYGAGEKMILCSHKTRREITNMIKEQQGFVATMDVYGNQVAVFDGIPVVPVYTCQDNDIFVINLSAEHGVSLATAKGIVSVDLGCEDGVHFRTMIEGLFAAVNKDNRGLVHIERAAKSK